MSMFLNAKDVRCKVESHTPAEPFPVENSTDDPAVSRVSGLGAQRATWLDPHHDRKKKGCGSVFLQQSQRLPAHEHS